MWADIDRKKTLIMKRLQFLIYGDVDDIRIA